MSCPRSPSPQGTLDMLTLQLRSLEPAHNYGIAHSGRRQPAEEKNSWARPLGAVQLIFDEGNR